MAAARSNLRMGLPFSFGIKCIQDNWTLTDILRRETAFAATAHPRQIKLRPVLRWQGY
jgi:hypothetical protein